MRLSESQMKLRYQSDLESINNLVNLLNDISRYPTKWIKDAAIKLALSSQGALSKYENADLSIHKMSLNHQKRIAHEAFGSFAELDTKRRAALEALSTLHNRNNTGSSHSKRGLLARIDNLEAELSTALQDLYILQMSYDIRCQQARSYAKNADAATMERCIKEQNELDVMSSIRKVHFDQTNIQSISKRLVHD